MFLLATFLMGVSTGFVVNAEFSPKSDIYAYEAMAVYEAEDFEGSNNTAKH